MWAMSLSMILYKKEHKKEQPLDEKE